MVNIFKLIASILVCLGAGVIGSIFTTPAIPNWYAALNKPFFTPPDWLFAPAWTTLYVLMAIAVFLVWQKGIKYETAETGYGCDIEDCHETLQLPALEHVKNIAHDIEGAQVGYPGNSCPQAEIVADIVLRHGVHEPVVPGGRKQRSRNQVDYPEYNEQERIDIVKNEESGN